VYILYDIDWKDAQESILFEAAALERSQNAGYGILYRKSDLNWAFWTLLQIFSITLGSLIILEEPHHSSLSRPKRAKLYCKTPVCILRSLKELVRWVQVLLSELEVGILAIRIKCYTWWGPTHFKLLGIITQAIWLFCNHIMYLLARDSERYRLSFSSSVLVDI